MNLRQLRGIITKSGKMAFPEHRDLVRQLGADSMVLLKNNGILPLQRGKVALFGAGAVDTLFCGIFYNFVYTDSNVNVRQGLENNGFTFSTESWLGKMEKVVKQTEKNYSTSNNRVSIMFAGMNYFTMKKVAKEKGFSMKALDMKMLILIFAVFCTVCLLMMTLR